MKKTILTLIAAVAVLTTINAQNATYKILREYDANVKIVEEEREIHHIVYEYPSKDGEGNDATISGIIMIPDNIADNSDPSDGIVLYNRCTAGNLEEAPSVGGDGLTMQTMILASPLKPNYIIVSSDYIGYGSSKDRKMSYCCGDVNARNSLDGLLSARQLLKDKGISLGKFQFNIGYSQGGTESMYVAKLCDMEYKNKGITFDKTFVGDGLLDCEKAYSEFVKNDTYADWQDVVMFLASVIDLYQLDIQWNEIFKEPLASNIPEFLQTKDKVSLTKNINTEINTLNEIIQPVYMDINSAQAKALLNLLAEKKVANGWEPDLTQNYYITHSRHDDYVPVQSARSLLTWMKGKGFQPSLTPGKTTLQTNMMVFKLNHLDAVAIWLLQTLSAIQYWPVVYYEGEQNRYYRDAVQELNLVKTVQFLESVGIDVRGLINSTGCARSFGNDLAESFANGSIDPDGSVSQIAPTPYASFFEVLAQITAVLAKADLTLTDFYEMIDDSGITMTDILDVYNYLSSTPAEEPSSADFSNAPFYLLLMYEQTLIDWLNSAGYNLDFGQLTL